MGGQGFVLLYRRLLIAIILGLWVGLVVPDEALTQPRGQTIIAVDFPLTPTFPVPAETPVMGSPEVFLYTLHDALLQALLTNTMIACLAESRTKSSDALSTAFNRREGLMFHYKVMGWHRVCSHSTEPWPDMSADYGTSGTRVAGVVLKHYREQVGDD